MNQRNKAEGDDREPISPGVLLEELDSTQTLALLERFVTEYVDPKKRESLTIALHRSPAKQRPIDYEKFLRPDCTTDVTDGKDLFRWLSADGRHPYCHFFEREASRPGSRIKIATLNEALATSWSGIFVNFDAGRALAVTLDLDRFRCDIRGR